MGQRFAASAIAIAIVVARFLTGSGVPLPHAHGARTALATTASPARSPARSLRADRGVEVARVAIPGALIAPSLPALPAPPPPIAAPRFVDPLPPLPPPPATAARARAPPVQA